jgi:hypothetical protein
VDREAGIIEGTFDLYPAVVGPEAAGEDNHADTGQVEILGRFAVELSGLGNGRRRQSPLGDEFADEPHEISEAIITPGNAFGEIIGEPRPPPLRSQEVPVEGYTGGPECAEVQIVTVSVARRQNVCRQSGSRSGQLIDRLVQETRL